MTFSSGVINVRSGQVIDKAEILENNISGQITDAAIEVHKILGGPGLLEGVYEESLCQELNLRGLNTQRQICLPIQYKGIAIGAPLRLDLLVGGKVIVEVKATENNSPIHKAQLLTYLRLSKLKLGLVLNFGRVRLIDGLTRVVNGL
jgi:GxxExxY protein